MDNEIKPSRTFGSFQKKLKAMFVEKIREINLAFYFSYAYVLLKFGLFFKNLFSSIYISLYVLF